MKVFMPQYYKAFRCIASACPDSCCKEWSVDVDPQAAAYYRSLEGALGDHLRQVLQDTEDGAVMTITDGRCPMWRQDGLCRIQAELGHEALCKTCQEFPRLRHDYGDFVELGLALSCPEAARMILNAESGLFLQEEISQVGEREYDADLMVTLRRSRQVVLNFLGDDSYSLPQALAILLLYAHDVQNEIDGGAEAFFDPAGCLDDAMGYAQKGDGQALIDFFRGLEILTEQWANRLEDAPGVADWNGNYRALVRYFVERYWLQAVADYDLVCRVKFIVAACVLICRLGGDLAATAQLFSKEIENDPDNLDAILDGAYASPALTDVNLLSLLLG